MRNVEYQGYGVDFTELIPGIVLAVGDHIADPLYELVSNAYEVEPGAEDVSVYLPCNTDGFGCLFLIDAVVPVSSDSAPIKTYTVSEANDALRAAIMHFIECGVEAGYIASDDYAIISKSMAITDMSAYADYSWKHNWTDYI